MDDLDPIEELIEAVRAVQTWDAILTDLDEDDPAFDDACANFEGAIDWLGEFKFERELIQ